MGQSYRDQLSWLQGPENSSRMFLRQELLRQENSITITFSQRWETNHYILAVLKTLKITQVTRTDDLQALRQRYTNTQIR